MRSESQKGTEDVVGFWPDKLARRMVMLFSNMEKTRREACLGEELRACFSHLQFNMPIRNFSGMIDQAAPVHKGTSGRMERSG